MKRLPKIAGAGPLADYVVGQRVMTREGIAGVITDIHEGPGDLTTYWVTLDGGLGGGEYAEAEIWPETSNTATIIEAGVEHTAADDYPELGSILTDRLPPQIRTVAGVGIKGTCTRCGKGIKIEKGSVTHADGSNEHAVEPSDDAPVPLGVQAALDEAARRLALTLAPKPSAETEMPEGADPSEEQGYRDGLADGRAGVTRNPQDPTDLAYRAGYDRGWAHGVDATRGPLTADDFTVSDSLEDAQTAGTEPTLAALHEGGFWQDLMAGDASDPKYDGHRSYDWCRYRRDHHCFYSKTLDVRASEQAGYAVWVPEDRGVCQRRSWKGQQACELALPGKNVPGGYTDATIPWEQGGQRGGQPTNTYRSEDGVYRQGSIDPVLAFHITSAWRDVQAKAKRIRSAGGVRVVAAKDGIVVAYVRGDQDVYETELVRVPGRKSIGSWACGCKWGSYSWGRSGPWKRYEGRMCSHALAAQYEAQARGMFERQMTLDEKQPAWMDKDTVVRTPGSYDRSKGRYSSLNPEMRPVTDQADDDAPLRVMVAAMQAEGIRYAEIRELALALGVQDVPGLVRTARGREISFAAKVRGLIRRLLIADGEVREADTGKPVAIRDILFPGWDPKKGLDYREPTVASAGEGDGCCGGSCGCGDISRTASRVDDHLADSIANATSLEQAAQAMMALARRAEPEATRLLKELAAQNHGRMAGLDFRFKSESSLLRKMRGEASAFRSPGLCAMGMSDPLRYTILFSPDTYTENVQDVLKVLDRRGYGARVKNYWLRGDAYNGVNVALSTPNGFPMELQFHTDESLRIKEEEVHPIYEKWRVETDPNRKAVMSHQMRDLFDMVPRPAGALGIQTLKRQEMTPHHQVQWFPRAAALEVERYVLTDSGVLLIEEPDGSVMMWSNGRWRDGSLAYGGYFYLGDPRSEEITQDEALAFITASGGFEPSYNGTEGEMVIERAHSTMPAYDITSVFGSLAALGDEPEAALPVTYGDDEEDQQAEVAQERYDEYWSEIKPLDEREAGLAEDVAEQFAAENPLLTEGCDVCGDSSHTTEQHEHEPLRFDDATRAAALVAQAEQYAATGEGPNPFAHLGLEAGSAPDDDIMAAAQQHLAKEALKTYSPAEKKQIIDEGLDVEASNLDRLDISGTHYEALEAALAKNASLIEADEMWLIDGDPNG